MKDLLADTAYDKLAESIIPGAANDPSALQLREG